MGRMIVIGLNGGYLRHPGLPPQGPTQLLAPSPPGQQDAMEAASKKYMDEMRQAMASGSSRAAAADDAINKFILTINQVWAKMPRSPGQTMLDIARDKYFASVRQAVASRAPNNGQAAIYKAWSKYERQEAIAMIQIGATVRQPEQVVWREMVERYYNIKIGVNGEPNIGGGSGAKVSKSQNSQKPSGSGAIYSTTASDAKAKSKDAKGSKAAASSSRGGSAKLSNSGSGNATTKPKDKKAAGSAGSGSGGSTKPSNSGSDKAKTKPKDTKVVGSGGSGSGGGPAKISNAAPSKISAELGSLEQKKATKESQSKPVGWNPSSETPPLNSGSGSHKSGSGEKGKTKKETKHVGSGGTGSGSGEQARGKSSSLGRNQIGDMIRTMVEGMVENTKKKTAAGAASKKKTK